ncbi:MAG: class I SAM-dependent methyltransferase [Rhodocyclales bacterium]|nr:class I SAM-dependent methyltransferase [Rhodocyclales bacterium]
MPPLRAALLAQILGALMAVGLLALAFPRMLDQPLVVAVLQGLCAAYTSHKLDAPPWWHAIHLGFMPLAVLASRLPVPPGWYLAAFLLLLVVYWRVAQSRVPLYLSSAATATAVAAMLPPQGCRIIDLGCGNGTLLRRMARLRPDCSFVGVEYAPLPWLWARLNCAGSANCRIVRGDYWRQPLADYDLVYAFLSPVPMPRLWAKACAEMKAGARLVSNTFAVPEQEPDAVVEVSDGRTTRLYCYHPKGPTALAGSR